MAEENQLEMTPEQMEAFENRMDMLMLKAKDTVSGFINGTEDVTTFDVVQYAILFNIYIGKIISDGEYRPERPLHVKDAMVSVFSQAFAALDVLAETNEDLGPNYVPERFRDIKVEEEDTDAPEA